MDILGAVEGKEMPEIFYFKAATLSNG